MANTPNLPLVEIPQGSFNIATPYNESMQALDALVQLSVISRSVSAPPTTTAADVGKRWIVAASPTGAWANQQNRIALCVGANLWKFYQPNAGWIAWNVAGSENVQWNGAAWGVMAGGGGGGGIPEAPVDGNQYLRFNGAWAIPTAAKVEFDNDGTDLTADDVQAALVEINTKVDNINPGTGTDDGIRTVSISSGTATLNFEGGTAKNFALALSSAATLATSNLASGGKITEFEMLITNAGSFALTLPSSFKPLGGSDTSVAPGAGVKTMLSAKTFDGGTTWAYAMQELG